MEHSLSNFKLYEDFAKVMGKEIITKNGHKYVCCDSESFDIRFEHPLKVTLNSTSTGGNL